MNERPERMFAAGAALRDIFECTPADLLTTAGADVGVGKTCTASRPNVVSLDRAVRPRRVDILDA